MIKEKEYKNIKWYLNGDLKLRQQDFGNGRIGVWVLIRNFNVCFTMIMYDFNEWCHELDINLEADMSWNNHRGFLIDSKDEVLIKSEIKRFIDINDIKPSEDDKKISDVEWYS